MYSFISASKRLARAPLLSLLVMALATFLGQPGTSQAQQRAAGKGIIFDYVTFYESPGFRGASFSVEGGGRINNLNSRSLEFFSGLSGFSNRRRASFDNALSSIAFNGAFKVTLYRDRNFEGPSASYTTAQRTLRPVNGTAFDNQVSSLEWEPLVDGQGQPRAIFYNRENFQGNEFFLYPGDSISKLKTKRRKSRSDNWDDEIRSIRMIGSNLRLTLYADKEYRGKRVTISSDAESLQQIGFGAAASSLRVGASGQGFN